MPAPRRVCKGATDTLTAIFYDGGEIPVDKGACNVTVTSDTGAVVAGPTLATDTGGVYTYTLPAAVTALGLDLLSVAFVTATETVTQQVEVVGGFYFELAELRAMNDVTVTYSTERLRNARAWIETIIDNECNTSFVRRYARDLIYSYSHASDSTVDGFRPTGTVQQPYPVFVLRSQYARKFLSITAVGTALSPTQMALFQINPVNQIVSTDMSTSGGLWSYGYGLFDIRYEAGCTDTCPADLRDVALQAARWRLISTDGSSGIPSRATSITNDLGNIQLSTPKVGERPTGIPDVDAVIMKYASRVRVPMIAAG